MAGMERGATKPGIKIAFANVQSIGNKMDEMRAIVAMIKPEILAITETWTHEGIGNEVLNIDGYEITARHDRNDTDRGRGGGIIIYARNNVNVAVIENKANTYKSRARLTD